MNANLIVEIQAKLHAEGSKVGYFSNGLGGGLWVSTPDGSAGYGEFLNEGVQRWFLNHVCVVTQRLVDTTP